MTRAALVTLLAIGLGGCRQPPEPFQEENEGFTPDRPYHPKQPIKQAALGENLTKVDLPKVASGKSAQFRFGREEEHDAWLATLPDRQRLVSVAYGDGRIYVGGGFDSSTMYALDAKTGKREWANQNLVDPGPTQPVFDDDQLAFNTFSCTMIILEASTGRTLWEKWLGTETPNMPAFSGNLVLAAHPTDDGFALSAYKRRNGTDVWSSGIDAHILTAPVVYGDSVYVATVVGSLYRIGLDGRRIWRQRLGAASAPWIDGNEVHIAVHQKGGEAQVVLAAADGSQLRTVTTTGAPGDMPGDDFGQTWAFEGSRPVVIDGVRYTAMGGRVEARDEHSGELKWQRTHKNGERGRALGSVVVAGPLVLVTTRKGELMALDRMTGDQFMGFDFGTPIAAQPVVANGWMYIATARGQVLAFELGNDKMDGWHMWGGNAGHNL